MLKDTCAVAVVCGYYFEKSESVRETMSKAMKLSQIAYALVTKASNPAAAHSAALCAAMRRFLDRARAYALTVAQSADVDREPQEWQAAPAAEMIMLQDGIAHAAVVSPVLCCCSCSSR